MRKIAINRLPAPTFFSFNHKLVAVAIFRYVYFVEEGFYKQIHIKVVLCGFYNHYRSCFLKWQF